MVDYAALKRDEHVLISAASSKVGMATRHLESNAWIGKVILTAGIQK